MRKKIGILFISLVISFFYSGVQALEEKIDDLSASVEVAPVFSLSLNNTNVSFGLVEPGETKVLGEGRFFNEVRCQSNSGRPWYLKANLISLKSLERDYSLPPSSLKWKITESKGSTQPLAKFEFKDFSQEPQLIYASDGKDNRGKEVLLRFQYSFNSPGDAAAGNYRGNIVFTMTEVP